MVTYKYCSFQTIYLIQSLSGSAALFDSVESAWAFSGEFLPVQSLFFSGSRELPLGDWISSDEWDFLQGVLCYPCSCYGPQHLSYCFENKCACGTDCIYAYEYHKSEV